MRIRTSRVVGMVVLLSFLIVGSFSLAQSIPASHSLNARMLSNRAAPPSTEGGNPCPSFGTTMTRSATAVDKNGFGQENGSTTMTVTFVYAGDCEAPFVSPPKCGSQASLFLEKVRITKCATNDPVITDGFLKQASAEDDASYSAPGDPGDPLSIKISADQYGNITVNDTNSIPSSWLQQLNLQ